jgi:hypothetical protein
MKIAFYKAKDHLFNLAVSWWDRGPYSHCELVGEHLGGNTYMCYSSSFMDKGVRAKAIELKPEKWDVFDVDIDEAFAMQWFAQHNGNKYDTLGLVGFLIRIIPGQKNRWFCSEAVAAMMGMLETWRLTPNSLACFVKKK